MKKISLAALVLCALPLGASADTLNDVLAYTYENSSTILAQRFGLKATDETIAKAKAGYRPNVRADGSIGQSYNKQEYEAAGTESYHQTPTDLSVSMVQPIFSGLSTYNAVNVAESNIKAGRSNLKDTEQNVLVNAVTVYMDVIRDQAVLDLQISQEKVLKQHLDSYKKRFRAGELTRTDIAQSEARLSGATASRISAEGQLLVSQARYLEVVGKEPIDLKDVTEFEQNLPHSLDESLMLARTDNPRIKAAEQLQNAAKYDVKSKKGGLSPTVDVRAVAGRQTEVTRVDESKYWRVTANMGVPLFQSGSEYADVRMAKQVENQYRILLQRTRNAVRADTASAWERYQSSKSEIDSIKAQIKASKTALEGVIREANVGQRTVLDVLDAEQEHLDNQVSLIKAHREEVVSAYGLLSAIGQLTPEGLNLSVEKYEPEEHYRDIRNKWFGFGDED